MFRGAHLAAHLVLRARRRRSEVPAAQGLVEGATAHHRQGFRLDYRESAEAMRLRYCPGKTGARARLRFQAFLLGLEAGLNLK